MPPSMVVLIGYPAFDLNADAVVDDGDRDVWLSSAASENGLSAPYLIGDSNLDLRVNVGDLNVLGIAWQSDNNNWSNGNVTGGGVNANGTTEVFDQITESIDLDVQLANLLVQVADLFSQVVIFGHCKRRND